MNALELPDSHSGGHAISLATISLKTQKRAYICKKEITMVAESKKLSNLQIELLKLFTFDLSDVQLVEIKTLLANYFAQKATDRMDELWEENGWTEETMKQWGTEHMRTHQNG